jgi:hypothetical protein
MRISFFSPLPNQPSLEPVYYISLSCVQTPLPSYAFTSLSSCFDEKGIGIVPVRCPRSAALRIPVLHGVALCLHVSL